MAYIINEVSVMSGIPKNVKEQKSGKIRMEACLQTADDINRNGRLYKKQTLQECITGMMPRIKNKQLLGELDHPTSAEPSRQITVLYKEASHVILDVGWEGKKLIGVLETLTTPNGKILGALALDKINIGFSFRGMGDLQPLIKEGRQCQMVTGKLMGVTWDSVSYPSHAEATMSNFTEISESVSKQLYESVNGQRILESNKDYICLENGMCFLPNDFDKTVELYKRQLLNKF